MKYSDVIAAINAHLTEMEALVAALPNPVTDLTAVDTRLQALIGTLTAKAGQ